MAHAAVANGGTWQAPRLVKRLMMREDPITAEIMICHCPSANLLVSYLIRRRPMVLKHRCAVMESGTGKRLALNGYSLQGKTGTTDVLANGRHGQRGPAHVVCWLHLLNLDKPQRY